MYNFDDVGNSILQMLHVFIFSGRENVMDATNVLCVVATLSTAIPKKYLH